MRALRALVVVAVMLHLAVFSTAVYDRLSGKIPGSEGVWASDFAVFYRAASLMAHGDTEEVLRYRPPGDDELVQAWPGLERGYWYARLPFLALLTVPLAWLPIEAAYMLWALLLLGANAFTSATLWRLFRPYPRARALLLAAFLISVGPIFIRGHGGEGSMEVWPWGWPAFSWPQFPAVVHYGTYFYGQDAPLLLAAFAGAIWAVRTGRVARAGLLFNLALAKPLLVLTLPLLMLAGRRQLLALAVALAGWGLVLNLPLQYVPGLDLWHVLAASRGYGPIFGAALLETHNYYWLYWAPVLTLGAVCLSGGRASSGDDQ